MTRRLALIAIHHHNVTHPSSQLTLSSLSASDTSFLAALSRLDSSLKKFDAIFAAVGITAKKFVFASEEQQAKVEIDLLTAEKLLLALTYMEDATTQVLGKELEDDEEDGAEGVFTKLMEKAKDSEDGISEMILQVVGKVLAVIGDVEIPDESELDQQGECEREDEVAESGEETSQSGATCGEVSEDWYVDLPSLSWVKDIDALEHHEYHVQKALEFLNRCIAMVEELQQVELMEILAECQKVVKQARGKEIISDDDYFPTSGERNNNYRGGAGEIIALPLVQYRQLENSDNGGTIDHRIYNKAQEFINLIELTMKPEDHSRSPWNIKDEWLDYYKQTIPKTEDFAERLRLYATKVEKKHLELDERVLEALEDLLEQGKGKVDADAEEEDDASLSLDNLPEWGEQGKLLVLIRGYCKLLKDEGKQPEAEVLRLAQIVIERANEQYKKNHQDDDYDCGGHLTEEGLSGGNARTSPERVILCKMDLSGGEGDVADKTDSSDDENTVVDGGTGVISQLDEDLEAEAVSESKSEVLQAGDHLLILTEDGDEICEAYAVKLE
jgi:hypothetical protein